MRGESLRVVGRERKARHLRDEVRSHVVWGEQELLDPVAPQAIRMRERWRPPNARDARLPPRDVFGLRFERACVNLLVAAHAVLVARRFCDGGNVVATRALELDD